MIGRRVLVGCLVFSSFAFFAFTPAAAQDCASQTTVLGSVEGSDHVIVLRVLTVDPAPYVPEGEAESPAESTAEPEVQKVTLEVVRVYKGGLKPREILTFGQYPQSEGAWSFAAGDIGHEFLFYLSKDGFVDGLWWPNTCGRSNRVEMATDDLLYLDKQQQVLGKTRVSGTVSYLNNDGTAVEGITVRFTGANRTFVTKTDARGVYELYDLPPGKYMVAATLPTGWKLDEDSWYVYSGEETENPAELPKFQFKVVSKKHVAVDLYVEADNSIRGRIFFPFGGSLAGDYIKATRVDGTDAEGYFTAEIKPDGSFTLSGLPSGGYVLVVNEGGTVSSGMPFKEFFYPGVTDRSLATTLFITPGQRINGINITAAEPAAVVTVTGQFIFADGKPAAEQMVEFTTENTDPKIYADAAAYTDAEGRFTLRVLKGFVGTVVGRFGTYTGEYEDCPEIEAALRASAAAAAAANPEMAPEAVDPDAPPAMAYASFTSEAVTVSADQDKEIGRLALPFAACKKAVTPQVAAQ
jgi:hypothetical protein